MILPRPCSVLGASAWPAGSMEIPGYSSLSPPRESCSLLSLACLLSAELLQPRCKPWARAGVCCLREGASTSNVTVEYL